MAEFRCTTAKIAGWNLAGFGGIPAERLARQIEGLALLDAEVVALVEINPPSALETLRQGLEDKGVVYDSLIIEQSSNLHIGVLFKRGITAQNARLLEGSDLGNPARRKDRSGSRLS